MVAPAAGAVVLVRFPFSDLSNSKLRPAVVLADAGRGDRVLCQITSKPYGDARAVQLEESAFASGSLRATSYVRPGKLFTASGDLITKEVGVLAPEAFTRVIDAVMNLLRGSALDQPQIARGSHLAARRFPGFVEPIERALLRVDADVRVVLEHPT